jgi:diguanylate cyclase (GGDEF)-like protein
MLDVDHFKTYNDTHGHLAGDAVLSGVGAILRDAIPEGGVSARYGGEEFVVLLPNTQHVRAAEIAEVVRCRVETHPFEGRERQPGGKVTVSLGVATFSDQDGDSNALIGRADEALYRAKETGRNRVVRAEP